MGRSRPMYDTIIIGAGMSGLAAGIRLAYYDQRVCILERHYAIGGLNSFYRQNDRNYDVGLHAVTNYTNDLISSTFFLSSLCTTAFSSLTVLSKSFLWIIALWLCM